MRSRAATATGRLREELNRSLFPTAPADALRFRGWEGALVVVSFLALAAVLQFFRAGPESIHDLFAEDGPVYSLRAGAERCRRQGASEARLLTSPEGWSMTITCQRLESEYAAAPSG